MEEYFASIPLSNSSLLCVGSITRAEARSVAEAGEPVDGTGYYLFLADEAEPTRPIEVLAKFLTAGAAESLARVMQRGQSIAL